MRPFDDDDDRSLIENWCTEEAKQSWELGHPPKKSERAARVGCMWSSPCSCLPWPRGIGFGLSKRLQGVSPVGWQRWRCQLIAQTRDKVIVFTHGFYGLPHLAEYSLLIGVKLKERWAVIGTHQDIFAKYGLLSHA